MDEILNNQKSNFVNVVIFKLVLEFGVMVGLMADFTMTE